MHEEHRSIILPDSLSFIPTSGLTTVFGGIGSGKSSALMHPLALALAKNRLTVLRPLTTSRWLNPADQLNFDYVDAILIDDTDALLAQRPNDLQILVDAASAGKMVVLAFNHVPLLPKNINLFGAVRAEVFFLGWSFAHRLDSHLSGRSLKNTLGVTPITSNTVASLKVRLNQPSLHPHKSFFHEEQAAEAIVCLRPDSAPHPSQDWDCRRVWLPFHEDFLHRPTNVTRPKSNK